MLGGGDGQRNAVSCRLLFFLLQCFVVRWLLSLLLRSLLARREREAHTRDCRIKAKVMVGRFARDQYAILLRVFALRAYQCLEPKWIRMPRIIRMYHTMLPEGIAKGTRAILTKKVKIARVPLAIPSLIVTRYDTYM